MRPDSVLKEIPVVIVLHCQKIDRIFSSMARNRELQISNMFLQAEIHQT